MERTSSTATAGIVLAGGRATRFGGDKLSVPYRGIPLLHHAVLRLAEVCDDVVVVLAPGTDPGGLPPGARAVHDPTEGQGPLVGLHAGLAAVAASECAVVVGGDMPDAQLPVLLEMLGVLQQAGVDAVALQDGDRLRPLPSVLRIGPAMAATGALLHEGRRRLRDLLDALRTAAVHEATWTALDPTRRSLFDVDEPGDLQG